MLWVESERSDCQPVKYIAVMTSTTYQVSGMTCGHCANAVTEEITAIDGVSTVSVDVESGQVIVTGEATAEQVAAAVSEAGYAVVS